MVALQINLLVLLAGMALGAGITGAVVAIRHLQARVRQLERSSQKRLPYRSADEIEDATAALLSLMFDLDMKQDKVKNALAHLQAARNPLQGAPKRDHGKAEGNAD